MKRHIGFIQSFAKGGNISSIEKRVAEVNAMIQEANEKDIEVVDTSVTWQAPMKYEPLVYKNGILYIKFKQLDLYHHNRGEGSNWERKAEKIGKHNTDYGVGEKEGYAQRQALSDIARMYRTALNHYNKYGYYADGGELGKNGFTIREMREVLNTEFPDSFGFKVFPIKKGTTQQPDYDSEILKGRNFYGLEDSDIKRELFFPQYKRDHEINYDIHQGGENTYFDFLLNDTEGNYYAGTFGFKDEGDVSADYITRFLVFLQNAYGLPFEIKHEVMAKGGKVKDEPVVRQYFEDEAFEYADGGELRKIKGYNFSEQIENGRKFKELIQKVYDAQGADGFKIEFIKSIALSPNAIVKSDGKNYLKGYSYKGTLSHFNFLDDPNFVEALKYVDRPAIRKFEDGGEVEHEPVIRQYFEDEAFEYAKGGAMDSRVNNILSHYVIAALWSSNDEDDEPLDANYSMEDIDERTLSQMRADIKKFITENESDIKASGMSDEQLGHDLWLTRNHHGAGFWDRGYDEEVGERLTEAAHKMKGTDLYVGDDGKIYAMGSYSEGGWMETKDVNALIKKDYNDEIESLKRQINYCNARMGETSEAWIQKEYRATINGCRERIDEIQKTLHNIGRMAAGGTFEKAVKAIEKKLTGSKVAAKYQSLYGKKYDKKEAHEAATKIKGKVRALELAKKHKKKK